MIVQEDFCDLGCGECLHGADLGFDFTMAFQPIVNIQTQSIFAYEALVRGLHQEPAGMILEKINQTNRYRFDQACRVKAIKLASELQMPCYLSINFLPNAVYRPELCIRTTLAAADEYGFPIDQIIFEITEGERVEDQAHLREIIEYYQKRGFKTAIDDFGAGYAGLNLLAEFQTDFLKLDMALIRHIETDPIRQAIVKGILHVCRDLGITPIAEGIETAAELTSIQEMGIELVQGYFFAKPAFEALGEPQWGSELSPKT
ncbi:EAL domain-containing protein [Thermosynechococcaceae cyanobacterium BACA0444]|uniref:EAL domain-containing protein n=1 Tax=Pseudocalidococcus azoricus BACA0444 TaxID=2918990 RepID=A0AAE4FPW3_9CYAN|nr:EAL domain-containing protein [Pseudocalidococcus azoricus]MDS3859493.1 EAL domain-containing protein [Pseudocalidococcus azoricus BACA0444]